MCAEKTYSMNDEHEGKDDGGEGKQNNVLGHEVRVRKDLMDEE